jgi:alkanesulfonate monooxygenase SsuD/methylene tetrahydromethanopterin reductase-like flavin-dependent oxidoreductase (luciferase family)
VHRYALAGDPDRCESRLREYVDAGARFIFLSSACPEDYMETNLQAIARDLIPRFRTQ